MCIHTYVTHLERKQRNISQNNIEKLNRIISQGSVDIGILQINFCIYFPEIMHSLVKIKMKENWVCKVNVISIRLILVILLTRIPTKN